MKIRLLNRQRSLRLRSGPVRSMAAWMLRRLRPAPWAEVALVLLDDAGIRSVNRAVFGKNSVTDVITQPYRPIPPETRESGDLFLNVEQAVREGRRRRGGATRELALYLVHGCLHLAGETDAHPAPRARMRRLERLHLSAAKREGLLDGWTDEVGTR